MAGKTKIALVIVAVVAVAVIVAAWFISGMGFSAQDEPTAAEVFLARTARSLATPRAASDMLNPVSSSDEVLGEAMAHFADHCAFCHANDGSGDTPIGKGLYPKPPDMRQPQTQNLTDGELFYIIHNGVRLTGMPAFGQGTPPDQDLDSWKLVHFIRHLPSITAEELEKMKAMNPKGTHEMEEEEAIRKFLEGEDSAPPPAPDHKH
jgi:mono/diheme cytochrome c family protein